MKLRCLLVIPVLCASASFAAAQDVVARLAAIVQEQVKSDGPGVVALVVKDGKVLYRQAHGLADVAAKTPLRPETPFYVASVAKSLTAACVIDLALAGKIALDDEVRKFVPELPEHCRGISLRHLLHHRSGLRDFYELELLASRQPGALTTRGVLDLLGRQRALNFAPGADFLYCNSGYLLLAEVVQRVTKKSLRTYANEQLFAPLQMASTAFRDVDHPDVPGLPKSYDDGKEMPMPPLLCGAGGVCSTVDDLQRWLAALTSPQWRPELVRELVTPPPLQPEQRRSPQFNPYAGGLLVTSVLEEPALLLLGGFFGWQATALALPASQLQVVLLANGDADALGIARELASAVLDRREPARPANSGRPGFALYRDDSGELLIHATRGSGVSVFTTLGWKVEVAEQDGAFQSVDARTPLTARRDANGGIEMTVQGERMRRYGAITMGKVAPEDVESIVGAWRGDEIDGDITLLAKGGRLQLDASRMALPVAPFMPLDRDTWVSDSGMQIEVRRDATGAPKELRVSTARARGVSFVRN